MDHVTPMNDGMFFENRFKRALRSPTYSVCYVKRRYTFRPTALFSPSEKDGSEICRKSGIEADSIRTKNKRIADTCVTSDEITVNDVSETNATKKERIGIKNIAIAGVYFIFAVCLLFFCVTRIEADSGIAVSHSLLPEKYEFENQNSFLTFCNDTTYVNLKCSMLGIDRLVASPVMTARDFIKSLDYGFDDDDILSCPDETVITPGMDLNVDVTTVETIEQSAVVPFETETRYVSTIPEGEVSIIQEGSCGDSIQSVQNKYVNGELVESVVVDETITTQPTPQIIEEGSGGTIKIGGREYHYSYYRDVIATAYGGPDFEGNHTSTGKVVSEGMIAVDPQVVALGSRVYVSGYNGYNMYDGFYSAEDTGGAIIGDKIDVYTGSDVNDAIQFGRRYMRIYVFD